METISPSPSATDDGTFSFTGIPSGDWRITVFDQWNDQIVDGISTPVSVKRLEAS